MGKTLSKLWETVEDRAPWIQLFMGSQSQNDFTTEQQQ